MSALTGTTKKRTSALRLRSATNHQDTVYPCGNAWKDFAATDANQLSLRKGEVIVVTERSGTYWWWGTNEETQVSGYFPRDHLWFHTPWRRAHDDTHNRDYYVNVMTGKSVWTPPEGFIEKDEIRDEDLVMSTAAAATATAAGPAGGGTARVADTKPATAAAATAIHIATRTTRTTRAERATSAQPSSAEISQLRYEITKLRKDKTRLESEVKQLKAALAAEKAKSTAATGTGGPSLQTTDPSRASASLIKIKVKRKARLTTMTVNSRASNVLSRRLGGVQSSNISPLKSATMGGVGSLPLPGASSSSSSSPSSSSSSSSSSPSPASSSSSSSSSYATLSSTNLYNTTRRLSASRSSPSSLHARKASSTSARGSFSRSASILRSSTSSKVSSVGYQQSTRRNRRAEVSAEVTKNTDSSALANITKGPKKSAEIVMLISDAIASNILFLNLDATVRSACVDAFREHVVKQGENVIVQGDKGDAFYVVQRGACEVLIAENGSNAQSRGGGGGGGGDMISHGVIGAGGTFGELALMYNTPRQATIRAQTQLKLWRISRAHYQGIVESLGNMRKQQRRELFHGVPLLAKLSKAQTHAVASVAGTETFESEEVVVFAGSEETTLYIVEAGAVELRETTRSKSGSLIQSSQTRSRNSSTVKRSSVSGPKGREMNVLLPGMYFGANALFSIGEDAEAIADRSAYAVKDATKLLTVSARDFKRIVGQAWVKRTVKKIMVAEEKAHGAGKSIPDRGSSLTAPRLNVAVGGSGGGISLSGGRKSSLLGRSSSSRNLTSRASSSPRPPSLKRASSRKSISKNSLSTICSSSSDDSDRSDRVRMGRSKTVGEISLVDLPDNWRDKTIPALDSLQFMQTIGKGSFGRVILAKVKETAAAAAQRAKREGASGGSSGSGRSGISLSRSSSTSEGGDRLVAIKKLCKADLTASGCAPHVMNERGALALSNACPYIINLYQTFSDQKHLYFVLELCRGGDLFGLLCKSERILEKSARFYVAAVIKAFAFMHTKDVVYRDLKPENLLIQESGYLKLADLGLAKAVPDGVTYTLCGTPVYMAPEMLLSSGHGKAADAWAVGIMIYELCAGYPPFEGEDQMSTYEMIINSNVIWPTVDVAAAHVAAAAAAAKTGGTLDAVAEGDGAEAGEASSSRRGSMWGVTVTPSYHLASSTKELITGLLEKDPTRRLGAATDMKGAFDDVIRSAWFSRFDWDAYWKEKMTPPALPFVADWQDNFEKWDEEEEAAIDADAQSFLGDDFSDF
jgi:serine/threonine protein kinase/CRP-like cAMP-binding protein